jgi:predicted HTH domain antitoxin
MNTVTVNFELPLTVALQSGLSSDNINQDVKLMVAIFLYEHRRISLSKACEISEISQWEFFELNRRLGIPIHYRSNDLKKDMEKLSDV